MKKLIIFAPCFAKALEGAARRYLATYWRSSRSRESRAAGKRDKVASDVCRRHHVIECKSVEIVYYVYALWNKGHDKIYVGMSKNPDKRLVEHNAGLSAFTKKYRPWHRFYLEEVSDVIEARRKEKYYKSGWGRKMLKSKLEEWQIT